MELKPSQNYAIHSQENLEVRTEKMKKKTPPKEAAISGVLSIEKTISVIICKAVLDLSARWSSKVATTMTIITIGKIMAIVVAISASRLLLKRNIMIGKPR